MISVYVLRSKSFCIFHSGLYPSFGLVLNFGIRDSNRFTADSVISMLPKDIQVLLFSATFPEKVMNYAGKFAPNAHSLKLQRSELTVKGISQMFIDCPDDNDKYDILCKLYGLMTIGQSVIFVKVCLPPHLLQC